MLELLYIGDWEVKVFIVIYIACIAHFVKRTTLVILIRREIVNFAIFGASP
jgi:hypothetical protein